MTTVIERLFEYIEFRGMKHTPIERELGLSNGYLGKMLKRKGSIGDEVLQKIFSFFPNLNMIWLLSGKGDMEVIIDNKTAPKIAPIYAPKIAPDSCQEPEENKTTEHDQILSKQIYKIQLEEIKSLAAENAILSNENAELKAEKAQLQAINASLKDQIEKAV